MNPRKVSAILISGILAARLSACGGSGDDSRMPAGQTGMPGMTEMPAADAAAAAAVIHTAEGTLNSVDFEAGTANISHGPIASANWPQMTMAFKLAEPNSARTLEPDQRIRFEFTIESGMSATVTKIEAIE